MNKKAFTALYLVVSTIINIIMLLVIIVALIALDTLAITKIFHCQDNANVIVISYTLCFAIAMVGNMILSAHISSWVIKKFHLEDKLETGFGGKKKSGPKAEEVKVEKKKTVLPDSVKITDEE